jgi:hypothetical protein
MIIYFLDGYCFGKVVLEVLAHDEGSNQNDPEIVIIIGSLYIKIS